MATLLDVSRLTERWTPLKYHAQQAAFYRSRVRFNVAPAGRRSGKTEIGKRRLVRKALSFTAFPDGFFPAMAPTYAQAKSIYWNDLKLLTPRWAIAANGIREGDLSIKLLNGATIQVLGLDKPERVEGRPIDHGALDEVANMKPSVWTEHLRPAIDTYGRMGTIDFYGVPEGRNHYYDLYRNAKADTSGDWAVFEWLSAEILPPEVIAAAKRDLDPLVFQQEYEASFVNFAGMAYYNFNDSVHVRNGIARKVYNPNAPLYTCFDFNVDPGVAVICQETRNEEVVVLSEVYIPKNSNTEMVARKVANDWAGHKGRVVAHGDATGGSRKSSSVHGTDWELVEQELEKGFGRAAVVMDYPTHNPAERQRVNAVNSMLKNAAGRSRIVIDGTLAPNLVKDFEGVRLVEGGSGELDKKTDLRLTHLTDAFGYYIAERFPLSAGSSVTIEAI